MNMVVPFRRSPLPLRSVLVAGLVLTAGCHYVKRDDFDTEIARVRQEMASGDQRVANQASTEVRALEARMDARFQALEQSLRTMEDEFGMRVDRLEGSLRVHTPLHFGFNQSTLESDEVP